MNKKGFTLVELLAVIAILAILVIIALPNVLKMFNESKQNSFMTEVRDIYKQAQTQFISDSMTTPGAKTYMSMAKDGKTCRDSSSKAVPALELQGRALNYIIELNAAGDVTKISVNDGSFFYEPTAVPDDASKIISNDIKTSGSGVTAPTGITCN